MADILKPETLALFLIFGAPGMVALYVRSQFMTGRMPQHGDGVAAYVALSLLYHAIAYPIARPYYSIGLPSSGQVVAWFCLLFIGPALLGLVLGLNVQRGWTKRLSRKLGLHTVHPLDSAWDWRFANAEACWVIAILKDGTKWAGYLGPESFVSTDPRERDIYIQKVYEISGDGRPWVPRESSVWIAQGELQSLEFWPLGEEGDANAADATQ